MYNLGTRDKALNKDILSTMLEQRRAQQKGYITLKEAAEISKYTPDYLGQLIRAGKIKGEQVYSNVAWVTTEEEIQAYLNDKSRTITTSNEVTTVATNPFNYFLYSIITCLAVALLVLQYIFYVSLDKRWSAGTHDQSTIVEIIPQAPATLVYE